jgi:amidohydrolase
MTDLEPLISKRLEDLVELRHRLHRWPELALEEERTAETVAGILEKLPGVSVRTGVAGTGVVAVLEGAEPGPCVALRADMDALPIQEVTGLPWASERPGVMHACGHDGHTTCLVGAAQVLSEVRGELRGSVKFIFQPAEERYGGAERMIQAGVLENPAPAAIFGMHGWPTVEMGTIGWRRGPLLASSTELFIRIKARGGHAAMPHLTPDPVAYAAQLITALQAVPARFTSPLDSVVISITRLEAGTATNVIPAEVTLGGTIRVLRAEVGARTKELVQGLAEGLAKPWGVEVSLEFIDGYPVTDNHPLATAYLREVAEEIFPHTEETTPTMGAEDFAYYGQAIPSSFWFLGLRGELGDATPRLHQPTFDFPDGRIAQAVRLHCELARRFAGQGSTLLA